LKLALKALILVGGLATRLRPLSLNRPKCLFPIKNKAIIDYLLENLAEAGCYEAILAVNNLSDKIMEAIGTEKHGIKIKYSLEEIPLGTGGPVKLAENHLKDDDFLVLNGDILSFIDYKELMYIHRNSNVIATLTLKQVEDPTRYGVVRFSSGDIIQEFVEKPNLDEAPSNWINAGCYALNPKILNYIPKGKISIEREVFPKLAGLNQLKGYRYYGEWIDIGVPRDYLYANKMLQKIKVEQASSICPDVVINEGSKILDSIVWEKTVIGKKTTIMDSIIGSNCLIGDFVEIRGAVIADNVKIKNNIKIPNGTKIWPNKKISNSIIEPNTEIK
jgi:mannose-1-phosphate guanylyltransferase